MSRPSVFGRALVASSLLISMVVGPHALAQSAEGGSPGRLSVAQGHATVLRLPFAVSRVALADVKVADYQRLGDRELYILGKAVGTTSLLLWPQEAPAVNSNSTSGGAQSRAEPSDSSLLPLQGSSALPAGQQGQHPQQGPTRVVVEVRPDGETLQEMLKQVFPAESLLGVKSTAAAIVLHGSVADAPTKAAVETLAKQYAARNLSGAGAGAGVGGASLVSTSGAAGSSVDSPSPSASAAGVSGGAVPSSTEIAPGMLSLLRVRDAQQVVLEVKIAEVSKTIADRLGVRTMAPGEQTRWTLVPQFTGNAVDGSLGLILGAAGLGNLVVDAQKQDGLVRVLAEPNIVALSGEEGKFLVGGRIFIPVTVPSANGAGTTTLQERPFGVGLSFVPTVLEDSQIRLRVRAEVSEVSKEPLKFTSGAATTVVPAITSRDVATTVVIGAQQSLTIGGLLRSSTAKSLRSFPFLGEIPILGTLFRSEGFNDDKTELVIVVTPRLLRSAPAAPDQLIRPGSPAAPEPVPTPIDPRVSPPVDRAPGVAHGVASGAASDAATLLQEVPQIAGG